MKKYLFLLLFFVLAGLTTSVNAQYQMSSTSITLINNETGKSAVEYNVIGITFGSDLSYMKFTTGKYWTLTNIQRLASNKFGFVAYSDGVKCLVVTEEVTKKNWKITIIYSDYTIIYRAIEY